MQNTENKPNNSTTPEQAQKITKLIMEMNDFDLRNFQRSINYGIFAVAIIDQDELLIPNEARDHVHKLHYLCDYLYLLEDIINPLNKRS